MALCQGAVKKGFHTQAKRVKSSAYRYRSSWKIPCLNFRLLTWQQDDDILTVSAPGLSGMKPSVHAPDSMFLNAAGVILTISVFSKQQKGTVLSGARLEAQGDTPMYISLNKLHN